MFNVKSAEIEVAADFLRKIFYQIKIRIDTPFGF